MATPEVLLLAGTAALLKSQRQMKLHQGYVRLFFFVAIKSIGILDSMTSAHLWYLLPFVLNVNMYAF